MAQQNINVGASANDNTGDTLRAAFQKVQANFDDLYANTGGGGITYTVYTANVTAVDMQGIIADSSGGSFTITLPATPTAGMTVAVIDGANFATNAVTVARNGSTIDSVADDLSLDVSKAHVIFIYTGSTWALGYSSFK